MVRRSLADRLIAVATPRWVGSHAPEPRELAPGLWSVDREIGARVGPRLGARMLLVDLPSGGVVAWSPVR